MSKQSDATRAAREARQKAQRREVLGAAYYQFHFAAAGARPPLPYYLRVEEDREEWRVKAERAAGVLGWTT